MNKPSLIMAETIERQLSNQQLHELAQWFSFHYGGGKGGREEESEYPREDIIDLVDTYIKKTNIYIGDNNIGFLKWFSEKYEIYDDLVRTLINNSKIKPQTTQQWIDNHFESGSVANGLVYHYFQDKIKGTIFQTANINDLKEELDADGIKYKIKK